MKLEIFELGAHRKSKQFETKHHDPDLIAMDIVREAGSANALASRNLFATWDPDSNTGEVFAGFRSVGKVRAL